MKKKYVALLVVVLLVVMSLPLSVMAESLQSENQQVVEEKIAAQETTEAVPQEDKGLAGEELLAKPEDTPEVTVDTIKETTVETKEVPASAPDTSQEDKKAVSEPVEKTAAATEVTEGDFTYTEHEYKEISITYKGTSDKIVIPASINGQKIERIDYINYTNMSQSQVKEIIFPEGILKIGDRVIFGDYNNLTTLTLPSTLESGSFNTISISGTGLTDTEGFKKVTKIKNLSIQNSQIQDLSGLSGLTQLEGINLSGNKDLTDISPLKSLKNLKNLTLVDTKVSKESQAELLSAVDMKFYMTSGLQEIKVLPTIQDTVTPQLLDYTIEAEDQGIAKFQYDGSRWFVQGLKAGKTRGIFKYNGKPTGNSFAIEVEGLGKEPEQPIGDKIENLPTLGRAATPSGAETLGLYDNGQLWQVSGDSAVKVMDNVKKYVGMETYVSKNGISWTMIEDKNGTLWTREIKGMEKPVLNERVKNVVKYVGVSAYGSNGIIGGCALDRVNNFWNLGNDNTNKIAQTDVKDFDALGFANTNTGVAVLKTNGDLLVKLYPSSNVAETDYVKVADGVTALESDERFVKEDGFYRYSLDTSVSPAKINTVKLGEDVKNTYAGGVFVVKTDGSTWYSDQYKILETEFKSYISQYMDGATTYFILDQNNTLWKWDYRYGSAEESVAVKQAENVTYMDYYAYLTQKGYLFDYKGEVIDTNVVKSIHLNTERDRCVLKNDHIVYRNGNAILNNVGDIIEDTVPYYGSKGLYMIRLDGTTWYTNNEGDPTPYQVSGNLEEVNVTGVTLDSKITLTEGGVSTLKVTVEPQNATNKKVTFESSNKNVASVDAKGIITAVAPGTAKIKVTTEDGNKTAECSVTVEKAVAKLDTETKEIKGIPVGEGSEALIANLKENNTIGANDQVQVLSAKGETIAADAPLATGMKVRITAGAKAFSLSKAEEASIKAGVQEYTVIVKGDINGDGKVSAQDIRSTQNHILSKTELSDCYLKAADTNADSKVSAQDIRTVQNHILGKQSIAQ